MSYAIGFNVKQSKILSFAKEMNCSFVPELFLMYLLLLINMLITPSINPFRNRPLFVCVCSECLFKTMPEKEKLLAMSNFFFSHSVFYPMGI